MPPSKNSGPTSAKSRAAASLAKTSSLQRDNGQSPDKASAKMHKRSRSGCFTCRLRRKKCDEGHPICKACTNLCVQCDYKRPMWWGNPEQRRLQKERIKNKIKQTKLLERSNATQDHINRIHLDVAPTPPPGPDFVGPFFQPYEPFGPHFATPGFVPISYSHYTPYEIDVTTESQTFVDDVPLRQDSSVSTFTSMGPPQLNATLPTFPADEWLQKDLLDCSGGQAVDPAICAQSEEEVAQVTIYDGPLQDHFEQNVLRMMFPILEVHQQGSKHALAVKQCMRTNPSYYHCCLSVAATHWKTTSALQGEQGAGLDFGITHHSYHAIHQLTVAYENNDQGARGRILDTTLAMILFNCPVGAPDEKLHDVPWSEHLLAASRMARKLKLHEVILRHNDKFTVPFSMSLISWIDILGSAILGQKPQFADVYSKKHHSGTWCGLQALMGCEDHVMYLIAEIAFLEALKSEGCLSDVALCEYVTNLANQLDHTEPEDPTLEDPYATTIAIRPDVLTKNITTLFRLAARIYLWSLVPGVDRTHLNICSLVDAIAETLPYIPGGPCGFDRSLVWPLFIAGVFSTSSSSQCSDFRQNLRDRIDAMEGLGKFGNLGRMYQLLEEYWLRIDGPAGVPVSKGPVVPGTSVPVTGSRTEPPPQLHLQSSGMREIKKKQVHWREVMKEKGWHYLLI